MKKEIVRERVTLLESFIDNNMSIEKLIHEKQMGVLVGRAMVCPFHEDLTPSMFVDVKNNLFKCLSCGRGGRYVKLYEHWMKEIQNININYYEVLEEILKSDPSTAIKIGFYSIFKTKSELLDIKNIDFKFRAKRDIEPIRDHELKESARIRKIVLSYQKGEKTSSELLDIFAQVQKGNRPTISLHRKVEDESVQLTSLEQIMDLLL